MTTRKSTSAPRRASIEVTVANVGATITAVGVGCGGLGDELNDRLVRLMGWS